MLQNFVAPRTIRAASIWTASSSVAFLTPENNYPKQHRYIPREDIYIFSKDFLETLNLRALYRFSLDQNFSDIDLTCSSRVPELENVRPRCLWQEVFLISVPLINRGGWNTGLRLHEVIIESVLRGLKVTSQAAAQSEKVCRSVLRNWAG